MQISFSLGQSQAELDVSSRAAVVLAIETFIEGVIAKMVVVVGVIKQGMPTDD